MYLLVFAGGLQGGFQVACLFFELLQLLFALLVLGGQGFGLRLHGGGRIVLIRVKGGGFLLQAGLAHLQLADVVALMLQLLLFEGKLAAQVGGFVAVLLLPGGGLLLGGFKPRQLFFEGGGFGGEELELSLLFGSAVFGNSVLLLQLGMFTIDFLDGGLGVCLFAFETLALALPRADLLLETGALFAQQGVLLVEAVLFGLLVLLGLEQELGGVAQGLVLPSEFVLAALGALVFGCSLVGGGEGMAPLQEVVLVLAVIELGGEGSVTFGGGGLAF